MTALPPIPVVLSSSSVYPEKTPDAFDAAAKLGYDGVEVMVYTDPVSQSGDALARLVDYHQVPVLAVHAPGLLSELAQRDLRLLTLLPDVLPDAVHVGHT